MSLKVKEQGLRTLSSIKSNYKVKNDAIQSWNKAIAIDCVRTEARSNHLNICTLHLSKGGTTEHCQAHTISGAGNWTSTRSPYGPCYYNTYYAHSVNTRLSRNTAPVLRRSYYQP